MRINSISQIDVPEGMPVAKLMQSGEICLWPEGYGYGTCLTMTEIEWERLRDSVEAARRVKRTRP